MNAQCLQGLTRTRHCSLRQLPRGLWARGHLLAHLGCTPAAPTLIVPPGSPCSGASVFWLSACSWSWQLLPAWEEGSVALGSLLHILRQCERCDLSRMSPFRNKYCKRPTPGLYLLHMAFREPCGEFGARKVTLIWKLCIHSADSFAFVS